MVPPVDRRRRWVPDENLVDHVRLTKVDYRRFCLEDRAWIVAGLTVVGYTAEMIAKQLCCSIRTVKSIKAEPMTRVAVYALSQREILVKERGEVVVHTSARVRALRSCECDLARLTRQRDRLISDLGRRVRKKLVTE